MLLTAATCSGGPWLRLAKMTPESALMNFTAALPVQHGHQASPRHRTTISATQRARPELQHLGLGVALQVACSSTPVERTPRHRSPAHVSALGDRYCCLQSAHTPHRHVRTASRWSACTGVRIRAAAHHRRHHQDELDGRPVGPPRRAPAAWAAAARAARGRRRRPRRGRPHA